MATTDDGASVWRGGQQISVEREATVFTTIVDSALTLERIQDLPEVKEVEPVSNRVFKVYTDTEVRDRTMERLRASDMGGVCHHAYRPAGRTGTRYYLTDQINIKFKPTTPDKQIDNILQEYGLRLLRDYPDLCKTFLVQVTSASGKNPLKVANALAERDDIEYAEPDLVERFQAFHIPSDTLFERQWHLRSWDGPQLIKKADVEATQAWDITRGNREIIVAVIDDGFDLSHPDFTGLGKIVHPKDYIDGDANPFPVSSARDYHGTPCAGVAIAEENNAGVVGIAPGCALMPIRFPLNAHDSVLKDIFDHTGQYADVISCSWGPPPAYAPLSSLMSETIAQLVHSGGPRRNGCMVCFAAGNYNAPIADLSNQEFVWRHPEYGLLTTSGPILNGYAAHPDIITVAATTSLNRKAAYSNWGKAISVSAPSNNFHPLAPTQPVAGRGIWTTDNEQFGLGFTGGSRFTGQFGGTSSATPLVAGIAALVRSANPNLTALEVKAILEHTADKIEDPNPDVVLGLSKGTYDASGHSEWFGYGKVNAAKAVARAHMLALSFARDIRPLFRQRDITAMRVFGGFDLSQYDDVTANAESIYERLSDGSMPCDGAWPPEEIETFRRWIDAGMPR